MYNCEAFISRCLDSILAQGLQPGDYEVIVVNDGSTDHGPEIVAEYSCEYPNFRLCTQQNSGVGCARNQGLDKAIGDYILFIDADDWLLDQGLSELKKYYNPSNPHDMYTYYSHTVDRKYDEGKWGYIHPHKKTFEGSFLEYGSKHGFGWSVWSRIIRREFLLDSGVRFTQHNVGEDILFMSSLFTHTNATVCATSLNIYRYWTHTGSAVNTVDRAKNKKAALGYIEIFNAVNDLSKTKAYPHVVYDQVLNDCRAKAFIRMISGCRTVDELKDMRDMLLAQHIFPINAPNGRKEQYMNLLINNIVLLKLSSAFYQNVFLPYIKPNIGRN